MPLADNVIDGHTQLRDQAFGRIRKKRFPLPRIIFSRQELETKWYIYYKKVLRNYFADQFATANGFRPDTADLVAELGTGGTFDPDIVIGKPADSTIFMKVSLLEQYLKLAIELRMNKTLPFQVTKICHDPVAGFDFRRIELSIEAETSCFGMIGIAENMQVIDRAVLDKLQALSELPVSLAGKSDNQVGADHNSGDTGFDLIDYIPVFFGTIRTVHRSQNPIRTALERDMKMPADTA